MKPNLAVASFSIALLALTLVPLWGVQIPPLVDLPEQLAVAKLFAEKVFGESALDLEIPSYLGYRLFPVLAAALLRLFRLLGLDVAYVPATLTVGLVLLNGIVLLGVIRRWAKPARIDWRWSLALFPLLTVYSSSLYVGFVNYFPAISFVILAISFAEKWFQSGDQFELLGFFVAICLVYVSHPFAFVFWLVWAFCRLPVLIATRSAAHWGRMAALATLTCVVVGYHATQTPPGIRVGVALPSQPFVPPHEWLTDRIVPLINGDFFSLEPGVASMLFGASLAGLVVGAVVHMVVTRSFGAVRSQLLLTALLFYLLCSLPAEAAFPVPRVATLFYVVRFASAGPAVLMTFVCVYLLNAEPLWSARRRKAAVALCAAGVIVCVMQLLQVRDEFRRFDAFARKNLPAIARGSDEVQSKYPSKFHVDGSYIRHYRCLFIPNCLPSASWFVSNSDSGLYPVRIVRPGAARP